MSKRSSFERSPRDYYSTPLKAVFPLLPHLNKGMSFAEPCAGNKALVNHIEDLSDERVCFWASDLEPQASGVIQLNALDLKEEHVEFCEGIITNPPFKWVWLKPIMEHFILLRPTILLLPADFMHNERFLPFLQQCWKIVSVGRVRWIEGTTMSSTDNFAWYFFDKDNTKQTQFYGKHIE